MFLWCPFSDSFRLLVWEQNLGMDEQWSSFLPLESLRPVLRLGKTEHMLNQPFSQVSTIVQSISERIKVLETIFLSVT